MIRIVLFLVAVAIVAAGVAWVADRPGEVAIVWLGYRIETSVMVAGAALAALLALAIVAWSILRAVLRSPEQVSLFFRHRRAAKGYLAVSRGLIAIGSGDSALARRSANDAKRLSPGDPLVLLLEAQSAQLSGDRGGAEKAFRAMLASPETKLLGLRGLYVEAQRRNDAPAARQFAEEAAAVAPSAAWASQAVLTDRSLAGEWTVAIRTLDGMRGALDKGDYRRKRAVLLTARALAASDQNREAALDDALEAVKLAPDLVPAAAFAGRRLAEAGNPRKARKILQAAWIASPHPDIADAYADVRPGDTGRERLNRMRKLTEKSPGGLEGALAVARAALDARDFALARDTLKPWVAQPTQRVASLMADIEQGETGDIGRAREWMARAMRAAPDPVWTADGIVSDVWRPVSPATGAIDAFQWKVPLAEIGVGHPVIDEAIEPPGEAVLPSPETAQPPSPPQTQAPRTQPAKPARRTTKPASKAPPETIIPLVQAPDDPGPDVSSDEDPLDDPKGGPLRGAGNADEVAADRAARPAGARPLAKN